MRRRRIFATSGTLAALYLLLLTNHGCGESGESTAPSGGAGGQGGGTATAVGGSTTTNVGGHATGGSCAASAQAAISSVSAAALAHGQIVTIRGCGFGTKDPVEPVIWDDFESGTAGQSVTTPTLGESDWILYVSQRAQYVASDECYAGAQCAHFQVGADDDGRDGFYVQWPSPSQSAFAHMKYRMNRIGPDDPNRGNTKMLRITAGTGDPLHTDPQVRAGIGQCNASTMYSAVDGGPGYSATIDGSYHQRIFDAWASMGVYGYLGAAAAAEGFAGTFFDGIHDSVADTVTYSEGLHDTGYRAATFILYVGRASCPTKQGYDIFIDNAYADRTIARIEIGNAASYDDCTLREMQVPRELWSAEEVRFQVNQGSFAAGAGAHLFLINAAGGVSDGVPVTFD